MLVGVGSTAVTAVTVIHIDVLYCTCSGYFQMALHPASVISPSIYLSINPSLHPPPKTAKSPKDPWPTFPPDTQADWWTSTYVPVHRERQATLDRT
ncbi:hypothetical protein IAQ61_008951 [Plenodomus lingam]|uniref:uncharacterized protein n=1 Tax=Leptosphaeria maculans TaxID=5022 RepID=UPI003330F9E7|nr:hypothetical protein IAQ61_008951 [Plenodomus lingam]